MRETARQVVVPRWPMAATSDLAEDHMIDRIDQIVLNCRDVETAASWYERALGFECEVYSSPAALGQRIALKFGKHKFNLRLTQKRRRLVDLQGRCTRLGLSLLREGGNCWPSARGSRPGVPCVRLFPACRTQARHSA